ncbi:MAG: TetR/AcrR family transcriptional regulator [Cyanobacteria bacterium]|nr:TetR/AcrR family transcriptional regulator [Cyanobacteriota bacterium]
MKRSSEKSHASRKKMVQAAGKAFRENGFGGIGVDGLAKAADFTSGAFYFHFKSKLDAFIASLEDGLDDLNSGIQQVQENDGDSWVSAFAAFYLGYKRTCELPDACTLAVLSSEIERAGLPARSAYEAKMKLVFESLAQGFSDTPQATSREQALALMALLAGGALLSRTVADSGLSEEIGLAVQKLAEKIPEWGVNS